MFDHPSTTYQGPKHTYDGRRRLYHSKELSLLLLNSRIEYGGNPDAKRINRQKILVNGVPASQAKKEILNRLRDQGIYLPGTVLFDALTVIVCYGWLRLYHLSDKSNSEGAFPLGVAACERLDNVNR